eukprot:s6829_g4.t1
MYRVTQIHQTRRRFQAIADTRAQAREAAKADFGVENDTPEGRAQTASVVAAWELAKEYSAKETELKAEAKAEETEINEPTASSLDRISSKRDNQVESLQTSLDPAGHLRVAKTLQKLELPHNSESYRRVMKVEAYTWLCMSARFKAKAWLQGLKLEHFVKFVDFVLGDKVAGLRLPTASGVDTTFNRPPWQVVLSFELKLRTEAMKMVIDDGSKLSDALEAVTKDPSLKESFFTTPLALHSLQSLSSPLKYHKGKGKAKGFGVQPDGVQPPPAPHQQQRPTKGGKGKGKLNGQTLATKTPDGREICFAYNKQGCAVKDCPRAHVCRIWGCYGPHPASTHRGPDAKDK